MDYNDFKNDLICYIKTVLNDLKPLEEIADRAAIEEYKEHQINGQVIPPTTDPLGKNIDPYTYVPSRCTVPLAMICFSVLDFVGEIIGDQLSSDKTKDKFLLHSISFFTTLANRDDLKNETTGRKFQNIYRHSIMHTYLPASTYTIGYSVSYSHLIQKDVLFDTTSYHDKEILHVKYLTKIVKIGLKKLEENIQDAKAGDYIFKNYVKFLDKSDEDNR